MESWDRTRMQSLHPAIATLAAQPVEDWQVVDEMPDDAGFEPEEVAWFKVPEAGELALLYAPSLESEGVYGRIVTFVRSLVSMQAEPA